MKSIKRAADAVVHPLTDGMVVTLTKHGIQKIKEGKTVELELLSGGKQVKFLLMRDSTWEIKKKQREKEKLD